MHQQLKLLVPPALTDRLKLGSRTNSPNSWSHMHSQTDSAAETRLLHIEVILTTPVLNGVDA